MEWVRNIRLKLRRRLLGAGIPWIREIGKRARIPSIRGFGKRGKRDNRESASIKRLERELREAHREWLTARMRLDEALGADEVDYAVLTLEAAEKRYDMLLRKAKEHGLERTEWRLALTASAARSKRRAHGRKEETEWSKDG
jgi:hypothetical protein